MNAATHDSENEDWRWLAWVVVWSIVCFVVLASILDRSSLDSLATANHTVLGISLGGLAVTWLALGTWAVLIHLPASEGSTQDPFQQRMKPRLVVGGILLIEIILSVFTMRQHALQLALLMLTFIVGMAGPIIVWQWTHRRVRRVEILDTRRRNIRQMMGVTFTIAVTAAIFKLSDRWIDIPNEASVLIVSNAVVWTFILGMILGRYWWISLIGIPILFAQWIGTSVMIDLQGRLAERQINQCVGVILGFHFFSFLLLTLMRSSNHRWIGSHAR